MIMRKLTILILMMVMAMAVRAIPFDEARRRAAFLSDKMAHHHTGPGRLRRAFHRLLRGAMRLRWLTVIVTFALVALVNRTRTGLSIMATGMDRGAARLMGIRARHAYALTFGIAAALAGMAGTMVGTVGTFNPAAAGGFTLLSFVIAVLGGVQQARRPEHRRVEPRRRLVGR